MVSNGSFAGRWRAGLVALALLASAPPALAQQTAGSTGASWEEPEPLITPQARARRGFRLFGIGDFAITGLRQGGQTSWKTTSSGPSDDDPALGADLPGRVSGTVSASGFCCGYFELQLWMGAGRSDWSRARDVIPSLEGVRGGGWNLRSQLSRWVSDPNQLVFSGRDNSTGSLYSGVTTESGTGSCRDNSTRANDVINPGYPLLAGSDCPPTWAGPTFAGERMVVDTTWLKLFKQQGATFSFDDWKLPTTLRDPDRLYGSFQTLGVTDDFGRETRAKAGRVIPGQSGVPVVEGYPMGISWEWNVWTYAVPTIGDAMFYKVNIVNRSSEVYGAGINYDSLFLGFMVRPFHTTNTQAPAVYAAPERGTILSAQSNVNGLNCYGNKVLGTDIRNCVANASANRGFRGGGGALVMLKSPIGDLRNKKFTDPTSPYYMPSHPLRGDTLTYNILTTCGFTCATDQITPGSMRAALGAIVGSEADAQAGRGRTSAEYTQLQYHNLFRNADWPTRWSPATGAAGGFNRWVPPGNWDYNHDGVLDTMKVTTCITPYGCVAPFSDTIPGGFPNNMHNNYFSGIGPIKLKAGDTTSFIVAFVSSPDSLSLERQVSNIISTYQDFWLSPQPPTPARIVSATTIGGNRQFDTEIRLFFDQSLNEGTDQFLVEQARRLKLSLDPADVRLKALNPQIVNDLRARALPLGRTVVDTVPRDTTMASANACSRSATFSSALCQIVTRPTLGVVDSVFIFKSCDGGSTYTSSTVNTCVPSPARDVTSSQPGGFPWQSYARLARGTNGQFPNTFRDGSVTAGVTYTYVVVAMSFPAVFTVTDVVNGQLTTTQRVFRPKSQNALTANASNRNVAVVYLPASRQAGSDTTKVNFSKVQVAGASTRDTVAAYSASVRLSRTVTGTTPIAGRIVLSDSAEVVVYRADTTQAAVTSTTVRLFQLVDSLITGTTINRRVVARRDTFVVPGPGAAVDVMARLGTSAVLKDSVPAGSKSKYTIYRFQGPPAGGTRPQVTMISNNVPVFVTDTIPGTDLTPPNTLTRPDFNGLLLTFNPAVARTLNTTFWSFDALGRLNSPANPTIRWQPTGTPATSNGTTNGNIAPFSQYQITFSDKEFGPGAPFTISPLNPEATRTAYTASIAGRKNVGSTDVTTTAAAALTRSLGRTITTDSLVKLNVPFTIQNQRTGRPVSIAVLKSEQLTSQLFGLAGDTVRVTVPAGQWIPGQRLHLVETFAATAYDTVSTTPSVVQRVRLVGGAPDTVLVPRVTWGPLVLGCDVPSGQTPSNTCNPIAGVGGTGYTLTNANQQYNVLYYAPIVGLTSFPYTITPEKTGSQVAAMSSSALKEVRVVPNPYLMFSEYEQTAGVKRLLFTNLPPNGNINIYTASGQFVQRITWVESDLNKNCRATTSTTDCMSTGDLQWNMRSREDLEIGPGLYIFVVQTQGSGKKAEKLGKFVVIQ